MTIAAALPKESSLKLMKRLVKTYLLPYLSQLYLAIFFMAMAAAATAGVALLMQPVLDDILNQQNVGMIIPVAMAVLLTFCVSGISTYLHTIIMNKISQSIVADIQKDMFTHFMRLDLAFFHANPSGQLISRVINDVNVVRAALSDTMTGFGKNLVTLLFLVAVMVQKDWKLSLAAFAIFPFASFFVAYLGRRLRQLSGNIQSEMANLSDRLSQIFQGIRQVKAYGMEDHETVRAGGAIDLVKKLNIKSVRLSNISAPVNETLVGGVIAGIIIYGGYQISAGHLTPGQLGSFLTAFIMAYEPMKKLARLNFNMQTGLGAADRIFYMLDLRPELQDKPGAAMLDTRKPEIVFNNVEFAYEGSDTRALKGISFTAQPGKVTALVGPSGGGKTTIMNLIPRFYDVRAGGVTIDGLDLRDLDTASLRRHIALVSQDITIFDDTIEANIAYGRPGASMDQVILAAQAAAADEFIRALPESYQTRVGEDGVKLSGGQRQRIAIARAILRDAPILLLDEATSALDNESEKAVQKALEALEKGRTTIVIAHRLSTVRNADQIIVLNEGKIAETGTHAELINRGGLYAQMYNAGLKE